MINILQRYSPNRTHFSEFIDCFKTVVDRLREQLCKLLIVEYLERAAGWDLAHCRRVEAVMVITIPRLYEDRTV